MNLKEDMKIMQNLQRQEYGKYEEYFKIIKIRIKILHIVPQNFEYWHSSILSNFWVLQDEWGFPGSSAGKEFACNAGDLGSIPELGRSPGGGHGSPLQYSSLENPHGQRSLTGYRPWGHKELAMTEWLSPAHRLSNSSLQILTA